MFSEKHIPFKEEDKYFLATCTVQHCVAAKNCNRGYSRVLRSEGGNSKICWDHEDRDSGSVCFLQMLGYQFSAAVAGEYNFP